MLSERASNIEVKKINRNRIFRCINQSESISKPDISNALRLSMPTVLQNTNELLDRGLIREVGEFESTGGRKAKALSAIQDAHYAVGLDITQNHISLVLTDLSEQVLQHIRIYKPFVNEEEYFKNLGDEVDRFIKSTSTARKKILGVGVSIPGIIDEANDKIVISHALNIANVPCSEFRRFIAYPSVFINDANAAGIAEICDADKPRNIVYFSLSNSVGGAIILDNKLYLGTNRRSGEFGHMTLIPHGTKCYCGKVGCVDAYCSAKNLSKYTNGKLEVFFAELADGNEQFKAVWAEYLSYLALQINSLRMAFDCEVVLGGYVGSFIEPYLPLLCEEVAKLNTFELDAQFIKICKYRIEASALGAAIQHMEAFIRAI